MSSGGASGRRFLCGRCAATFSRCASIFPLMTVFGTRQKPIDKRLEPRVFFRLLIHRAAMLRLVFVAALMLALVPSLATPQERGRTLTSSVTKSQQKATKRASVNQTPKPPVINVTVSAPRKDTRRTGLRKKHSQSQYRGTGENRRVHEVFGYRWRSSNCGVARSAVYLLENAHYRQSC